MTVKRCPNCETVRSTDDFYRNVRKSDGLQTCCKTCSRARRKAYWANGENKKKTKDRARARHKELAEAIYQLLCEKHCVDCGEQNPVLLEFDHVKGQKTASISRMICHGFGIERIKEEIDKCVVRCVKCHRLKTAKDFGWYKWIRHTHGVR